MTWRSHNQSVIARRSDDPPEDGPEVTVISTTHPIAKREHKCSACGKSIEIGTRYDRYAVVDLDGKFSVCKYHRGMYCDAPDDAWPVGEEGR